MKLYAYEFISADDGKGCVFTSSTVEAEDIVKTDIGYYVESINLEYQSGPVWHRRPNSTVFRMASLLPIPDAEQSLRAFCDNYRKTYKEV